MPSLTRQAIIRMKQITKAVILQPLCLTAKGNKRYARVPVTEAMAHDTVCPVFPYVNKNGNME